MSGQEREALRAALGQAKEALPKVGENESTWCCIQGFHLRTLIDMAARATQPAAPAENLTEVMQAAIDYWQARAFAAEDALGRQQAVQETVAHVGPDGGAPLTRRDRFWYEQGKLAAAPQAPSVKESLTVAAQEVVRIRDAYGWCTEVDVAIRALADALGGTTEGGE